MRKLFFDCAGGASGDMIAATLFSLVDDKESVINEIISIGLPGTDVLFSQTDTYGISAYNCTVSCFGEVEEESNHTNHKHRNLRDVKDLISRLNLPDKIKKDVKNIYDLIANAESIVHNEAVDKVHFHEIGMLDALADITVCCYLFDRLKFDEITSSPINVGNGFVKCAHGTLPVPAPATAQILIGVPFYKSNIDTELCTPTGAAVIKYFVNTFSDDCIIKADKIGVGAGKKDIGQPNILRAYYTASDEQSFDNILQLNFTVDDMTGESLSFALDKVLDSGALDAYFIPVYMKKNRPAYEMTVICKPTDRDKIIKAIFKNTNTIGIRYSNFSRAVLVRNIKSIQTEFGEIQVKTSCGFESETVKIEYESIKKVALENNLSLSKAEKLLLKYI